jgi:hypothetical protein
VVLALICIAGQGCHTEHSASTGNAANSSPPVAEEEEAFSTILKYYRDTFPSVVFEEGHFVHLRDGPLGHLRVYVTVPVAVDGQYQHPFSEAFLSRQSASPDVLTRCIAHDLLLLKHKRLFSCPSRDGYDGTIVNCTTYVVEEKR